MSGAKTNERAVIATRGDLVICLDTGSVGVILEKKDRGRWLISFPHGIYSLGRKDFDILKSGGS